MLTTTLSSTSGNKGLPSICRCQKPDGKVSSKTTQAPPWCSARFTRKSTMRISHRRSRCRGTSFWTLLLQWWTKRSSHHLILRKKVVKTMSLKKSKVWSKPVGPRQTTTKPRVQKRRLSKSSVMILLKHFMIMRMRGHSDRQLTRDKLQIITKSSQNQCGWKGSKIILTKTIIQSVTFSKRISIRYLKMVEPTMPRTQSFISLQIFCRLTHSPC